MNAFIPVPGAKPITATARTPVQFNGQFITRFKDAPDAISLRLQSLAAWVVSRSCCDGMTHSSIGRDTVRKLLKSPIRREELNHRFEPAERLKIFVDPRDARVCHSFGAPFLIQSK